VSQETGGTEAGARPAPVTPEAVDESSYAWRRMHPATPLLSGWKVLVAALAIVSVQAGDDIAHLITEAGSLGWLIVLGGIVLVVVVGLAYSFFSWRVTRYAVTDEAVHERRGIVFKQQRQVRLDRLQAVDVVQPLLARLVGLSELRLEVAGGAGSGVKLSFLREAEAEALRAELLALAAGLRRAEGVAAGSAGGPAVAGPTTTGPTTYPTTAGAPTIPAAIPAAGPAVGVPLGSAPAPAFATAPERLVYELPMGRLLGSIALSGGMVWTVLVLVGLIVAAVLGQDFGSLLVMLPVVLGVVGWIWGRLNGEATFRAAISPDGIRLRHGLTEARSQTVPPGRVQAVGVSQPLLWRGTDWWRVVINVAGYSGEQSSGQKETVLHPVATREEAMLALWLVLPDLGVADPQATLTAAMTGLGDDGGFTPAPRRARWVDPIGWRRHGVLVTDRALVVRRGRWWRSFDVVPHERTQSLALAQGPVQRRLRVASFVLHSTPGPVRPRVEHLDAAVAVALLDEQSARARHARRVATPEQWMRQVQADPPPVEIPDGGPRP
jgi:putative membrane protein